MYKSNRSIFYNGMKPQIGVKGNPSCVNKILTFLLPQIKISEWLSHIVIYNHAGLI